MREALLAFVSLEGGRGLQHAPHIPVRIENQYAGQRTHESIGIVTHAVRTLSSAADVSQAVTMLVPSHREPAGQSVQLVREMLVPPDVNDPERHSRQRAALFPLYL